MDIKADKPHHVDSPTSAHAPSTDPGPLSPDLVASLQLNLSWLDLRETSTSTSTSVAGSGTQTPSASSLAGPSSPATTLAQRRMHRPPMFRRRSKSLDDVDAEEVEDMMDSLLDERERDLKARAAVRAQAQARDQLLPRPPPSARSTTASLAESQATSMPNSVTSSSLSTLGGGGSWAAGRGSSEPAPVPSATASGSGHVVLRMPSGAGSSRSSGPPTSSEDRLASWVRSTSQDSLSGPAAPPSPLPPPSPAGSSRGIRLPSLPPRQPYTPVLPSPLSTCSYTSNDDDDADRDRGFPFPATIHGASLTPETDDTSRAQSLRSSSSPPKSAPQTAVPSPGDDEGDSPRRLPAFSSRPAFQSFASGSTVSASTPSTVSGTPTNQPSSLPGRAADALRSPPSLTRNPTPSTSSIDFAAAAPSPSAHAAAAASSPPAPSSAIAIAAAARARSQTQGTSTSSQSHSFAPSSSYASSSYQHRTAPASGSDSRSRPPLTPPDGISSGPWQHNASATELAWHDVLSARFGGAGGGGAALGAASAAGGSDSSAGSGAAFAFSGAAALAALGADGTVRPRLHETGSWGASTGAGTGGGGGGAGGAGGGGGSPGKKGGWQGNELMGNAAAGTYAARTKDALADLLAEHVGGVPLDEAEETVHVVEYGALNSRSCALVSPTVEHFAEREAARIEALTTVDPDDLLSFQVTHADKPDADFRCLSAYLDADPDSYLRKSRADLGLDGRVFSTFAARPSGVKVLPKKSVSVGFSAMSLHWPSTDRKYRVAPATLAHGELMAFLSARASEFKPGGLLTLAYIARSEEAALAANSPGTYSPSASGAGSPAMGNSPLIEPSSATSGMPPHVARSPALPLPERTTPPGGSPSSTSPTSQAQPRKKDVWAHLTSVLGKAIQRLVSTGLLKPQVARQLLALPLHPRTPRQTQACLRASAHSWDVLESSVVVMSHPAWTGVEHGTVAIESWADQTIQVVKTFWEDEMRSVLRNALGSRGACEWVLDCLWTVAKEKLEEQPPHPLDLEVQLVALRRRERPASVPSSPVEGAQHKLSLGATSVDVMKRVDEGNEGKSASVAAAA
ncbi:hypothetical protein JCM9279_000330 [Rhodotorula babjevae]